MTIPSFRVFLRPVLEVMDELNEVANPRMTLVPIIKEKMNFTEDEAQEKLESGGNRLQNRVGWALTYLKKAGLTEFPKRGFAKITDAGKDFLQKYKGQISPKDFEVFDGYLEFKGSSLSKTEENPGCL